MFTYGDLITIYVFRRLDYKLFNHISNLNNVKLHVQIETISIVLFVFDFYYSYPPKYRIAPTIIEVFLNIEINSEFTRKATNILKAYYFGFELYKQVYISSYSSVTRGRNL